VTRTSQVIGGESYWRAENDAAMDYCLVSISDCGDETKTGVAKMTKIYEVTKQNGGIVSVEARNEFVAIAKAHTKLTGEKATSKDVTWHGVHAECKDHRYNKPVVTWSK